MFTSEYITLNTGGKVFLDSYIGKLKYFYDLNKYVTNCIFLSNRKFWVESSW